MVTPVEKKWGGDVIPNLQSLPTPDSSLCACLVGEGWWEFCHLACLQHQLPGRKQASESSGLDREAHGHDFGTRRAGAAHFAVLFHYKLSPWLSHFILSKSEGGSVLDGKPSPLHQDWGRQTWPFITNRAMPYKRETQKKIVLKQTMHLSGRWVRALWSIGKLETDFPEHSAFSCSTQGRLLVARIWI